MDTFAVWALTPSNHKNGRQTSLHISTAHIHVSKTYSWFHTVITIYKNLTHFCIYAKALQSMSFTGIPFGVATINTNNYLIPI